LEPLVDRNRLVGDERSRWRLLLDAEITESVTLSPSATRRAEAAEAPRFRGVSHLIACAAALPVGVLLVLQAKTGVAQVSAIIFAASVTAMLFVSSLFHRRSWAPARRRWIALLDHAMIYALIAGTYTPFCLLVLHAGWRVPILAIVWGGALVGTAVRLVLPNASSWLGAGTGLTLGWIAVIVWPQIVGGIGVGASLLLFAGGLSYTVGAIVYARRRPDPFPQAFGYHEIFHALTVVAVACQYATVAFFVLPSA
jgi:hemolysin III